MCKLGRMDTVKEYFSRKGHIFEGVGEKGWSACTKHTPSPLSYAANSSSLPTPLTNWSSIETQSIIISELYNNTPSTFLEIF